MNFQDEMWRLSSEQENDTPGVRALKEKMRYALWTVSNQKIDGLAMVDEFTRAMNERDPRGE